MESDPVKTSFLLFFVRHSERLDQREKWSNPRRDLTEKESSLKYASCDPPITEGGQKLAYQTGE